MGTKLTFSLLLSGIMLCFTGFVSGSHGSHHPDTQNVPHRCDVDSSEECNNWRSARSPALQTPTSSVSVRFFLHKNIHKPNESVELIYNNTDSIYNAHPHLTPDSMWKILIPAFPSNGKSPFPNNVRDAYMKYMRQNTNKRYNILIVDWDRDKICNLDTKTSNSGNLTYTGVAGEKVANMLIFLNDNDFLDLSENVHIIAFSVGAHVAAEAARFVFKMYSKLNLIYRISALDPASVVFWKEPNAPSPMDRIPRVRRSFVEFLDVYHTSVNYGRRKRSGDIDFYLNGRSGEQDFMQPGCEEDQEAFDKIDDFTDLCSHVYSTEIFAKSINDKSMKGCTGCDIYTRFENSNCDCEDEPILGEHVDEDLLKTNGYPKASGIAFVNTKDFSSFGEEFEERLRKAGEPEQDHERWRHLC